MFFMFYLFTSTSNKKLLKYILEVINIFIKKKIIFLIVSHNSELFGHIY